MQVRIALVGDYDSRVIAHQAIPLALQLAGQLQISFDWKHTSNLGPLDGYHGVWCVPASPYENEAAAIEAIRWARETKVPFLGTCGGFQHAVLEFARNVLGLASADHAETAKSEDCLVISRLSCSLVEVEEPVVAVPGSRLAALYGPGENYFGYHCNFGFNPSFETAFEAAGLHVVARGNNGEARAMELAAHPFFIGTLFQPERLALQEKNSPLVDAFVQAVTVFRDSKI